MIFPSHSTLITAGLLGQLVSCRLYISAPGLSFWQWVHLAEPAAQVFNVITLLVKFASCALAVGSGLPVGPEGPMVHIGAMVGAALSQGHSTTLGFDTGLFRRFQNPKDKRDFVTAGARLLDPRWCWRL